MSVRFRRLFDKHGVEIFKTEDIISGMEYYVSTGENFIDPYKEIACKLELKLFNKDLRRIKC